MNQPLAPSTVLTSRYQIERLLGQGGMGAVYKAWDLRLSGHFVAVKENFETSQVAQSQFQTEAILLANLDHPMLPRVTDHFIEPSGRQYLVMDYVEGQDLDQMVNGRGPVNESQAIVWMTQILNALEYLHTQPRPIIHRDIKPANIKIRPDGRAMLVDFGIAKVHTIGQQTVAGALAYSPGFSPLEQYGYGSTDARSDIYSVGATLYFILTGRTPPEARDLATGVQTLTRPSLTGAQVTAQTENAILKAMATQPAQRFQTVAEFRDTLNPRVGTKQIHTTPNASQQLIGISPQPNAYAQPQSIAQPVPAVQPIPAPVRPMPPAPVAPARPTTTVGYASYGRRVTAYLIDFFILYIAGAIIGGTVGARQSAYDSYSYSSYSDNYVLLAQCLGLIVAFLYYVGLTTKYGQTLGKKMLGIQVVNPNTGTPPSFGAALARWIVEGVEGLLVLILVGLLGFLWPLWDKQKQAWHDKAANTIVVRV